MSSGKLLEEGEKKEEDKKIGDLGIVYSMVIRKRAGSKIGIDKYSFFIIFVPIHTIHS